MRTIVTECNFDIMGICETFLDDNVADNEICIEGYNTVKKNRNRHGGGVILYIKEGIQYNEITNLAGSDVESASAFKTLEYSTKTRVTAVSDIYKYRQNKPFFDPPHDKNTPYRIYV